MAEGRVQVLVLPLVVVALRLLAVLLLAVVLELTVQHLGPAAPWLESAAAAWPDLAQGQGPWLATAWVGAPLTLPLAEGLMVQQLTAAAQQGSRGNHPLPETWV